METSGADATPKITHTPSTAMQLENENENENENDDDEEEGEGKRGNKTGLHLLTRLVQEGAAQLNTIYHRRNIS